MLFRWGTFRSSCSISSVWDSSLSILTLHAEVDGLGVDAGCSLAELMKSSDAYANVDQLAVATSLLASDAG